MQKLVGSAHSLLSDLLLRPWWLLALALGIASPASAQAPGTWAPMADLNQPRAGHTATLLSNGTVLIAGGRDAGGQPLASAEIYDPTTGGFTLLASPLPASVWGHTANRLNDGTVLIAGGNGDGGLPVANVQLFDPTTGTFTSLGSMASPRGQHTATLLRDGRVLIAGGTDGSSALGSLEIYDPGTRAFSSASQTLATPRQSHTATTLPDGRVLLTGGSNSVGAVNSAELYNPASDAVAPAGVLNVARTRASAALLLNGTVLVAGGQDGQNLDLDSAEVYDPDSNTFSLLPARMGTPRSGSLGLHLLNNGRVLIGGGTSGGQLASTIEVYDPVAGTFGTVASPATARQLFGANFFAEPYTGALLATGGLDSADQPLASAEAFYYPTLRTDKPDYAPGETVTLMGEGWWPNERVTINIHESSGDPDTNVTATAGATGAFSNREFQMNLLDRGVKFTATARGLTSGWTAQTKFTDAITSTLDQCKDDTNKDDLKDPCVWQTGSINPDDSAYHEGDSVAFRIWLDGLNPGSTHTVTIRYDFTRKTSGGVIVLGYDFLTHPDATETATSQRCNDIPGGVGVTGTTCAGMSGPDPVDIPSDGFQFSSSLPAPNAALSDQKVSDRETAGRQFVIFGGTFTSPFISSISKVGNPETDSSSQSAVTLTFTVGSGSAAACTTKGQTTTCAVNILFGGHLAKGTTDASGWGTGRGASSFPGASISMRMHAVDGDSSGAVNRSIQPAAVLPPAKATLKVIKHVTNDNGGTAVASDFTITVTGTNVSPASFSGAESPGTTVTLDPGSYSVGETGPSGYAQSLSADCSGSIAAGQTKTCTITNDDIQPKLIVIKHVVNGNGGTAVASDFTMSVTGSSPSPATFPGAESPGTTVALNAGSYSVSESGPSGYTQSASADCSGSIAAGETKTCTFTNDDILPTVIMHPTATMVRCDPTIFPFGSLNRSNAMLAWAQRCTATVSDVVVGVPATTPTGTVNFVLDIVTNSPFASCTLEPTSTTGVASCSVDVSIPTGMHLIFAIYTGDHLGSTGVTPFVVAVVPGAPGKVTASGEIDVAGSNRTASGDLLIGLDRVADYVLVEWQRDLGPACS